MRAVPVSETKTNPEWLLLLPSVFTAKNVSLPPFLSVHEQHEKQSLDQNERNHAIFLALYSTEALVNKNTKLRLMNHMENVFQFMDKSNQIDRELDNTPLVSRIIHDAVMDTEKRRQMSELRSDIAFQEGRLEALMEIVKSHSPTNL